MYNRLSSGYKNYVTDFSKKDIRPKKDTFKIFDSPQNHTFM